MPEGGPHLMILLTQRREELVDLARLHGLADVRVLGSVARGTATEDSDIDLLLDFDAETYGLGPLVTFRAEAEELLGHKVDVATPELLPERTLGGADAKILGSGTACSATSPMAPRSTMM